jgi:hypothetical protein
MKKCLAPIFVILTLISCSGAESGIDPTTGIGTYTNSKNNASYTLVITPGDSRSAYYTGDSYELTVKRGNEEKLSSGKVAALMGGAAVLLPIFTGADAFQGAASGKKINSITGTITFNDGTTEPGPGAFTTSSGGTGGGGTGGGSTGGGGTPGGGGGTNGGTPGGGAGGGGDGGNGGTPGNSSVIGMN